MHFPASLVTSAELRARGIGPSELRRLLAAGKLLRIRRGIFLVQHGPDDCGPDGEGGPEARHAALVRVRMADLSPDVVASHVSAAALHGLPLWGRQHDVVHVSRDRRYGGRRLPGLAVHVTRLEEHETVTVGGVRATDLARTVVDLARGKDRRLAVVAGDAALAAGLDRAALDAAVRRARGWPGVEAARFVCPFLDARSESPGESVSRLLFFDHGLPTPALQQVIRTQDGRDFRVDFCWPEAGVVGEFDGARKYLRPFRPDQDAADVVLAEKQREEAIRDLGWEVVRWTGPELADPERLVRRLRLVFDRSRTRKWFDA